MTTLYTVGHSTHALEHFLALLARFGIRRIADVRSVPYSKWAPHFQKRPLERAVSAAGVDYVFLGASLGGRPEGREFYAANGDVDYARRARAMDFRAGIEQLVRLASERPTAILCAEENPDRCHRRLLVTPSLRQHGIDVLHVRGDGRAAPEPAAQLPLFS